MRILMAEDLAELADTVAAGLRREGMAVDIALGGGATGTHTELTHNPRTALRCTLHDGSGHRASTRCKGS
jgi:DNA-binding response OmpR family regulator